MLPTDLQNSFVLKDFDQFFSEIILEKNRAISAKIPLAFKKEYDGQDEAWTLVDYINKHLVGILEEQSLTITHEAGDFASLYYREGQYIMAALADEIFLNLEWIGRDLWDMNLIETKIFGTQIAGSKFFDNLDEFLKERDPLKIDLGAVYYLALSLGFRGKYRGIDDKGAIKEYKRKLFVFVMRCEPHFQRDYLLFPEAYAYTQDEGIPRKLPNPRLWYMGLTLLVFFMALGGSILWWHATSDLNTIVNQVIEQE